MSTRAPAIARWLLAIGLAVVPVITAPVAHAYWTGSASGTGLAMAATLDAVDVRATPEPLGDSVHLEWTLPALPGGGQVEGVRVIRLDPGGDVDVCGSSATVLLPTTVTQCDDDGLPDGATSFRVVAVLGSWSTDGTASATVAADRTPPTLSLTAEDETHARLVPDGAGYRLFTNAGQAGSVILAARVSDSGAGALSARFPGIATGGWTHAAETVSSGSPDGTAVVYRSSPFLFAPGAAVPSPLPVIAADRQGNEATVLVSVAADGSAPSGGALRVNGVDASVDGSLSLASGSFSIDGVTDFGEAESATESGLVGTALTRAFAAASGGGCGAFGDEAVLVGQAPIAQDGLATGCYRYALSGIDGVGNRASVSTTVLVDTTAPVGGSVTASGTAATVGGAEVLTANDSWTVDRADFTDPDSGILTSVLTRSTANLSGGSCGSFGKATELAGSSAESSAASGCYRYTLIGTNAAGLSSTIGVTVQSDVDDPSGGGFRANGTWASTAVPVIDGSGDSVTISNFSDYSDGQSGISSSTLTHATAAMSQRTCGEFGAEQAVAGSGGLTVTGLSDGCHRFTLTGVDRVGRTSSVAIVVRIDQSAPLGGALMANGIDAASGAMAHSSSASVPVAWTLFADPESGMSSALLRRLRSTSLSNGVCGSNFSAATNLSTALSPSSGSMTDTLPTAGRCYRYELSGTSATGQSSTVSVVLMYDSSGPATTGSLTINGVTGTAAGRTTTSTTGAVQITQRITYSDSQSGVASDVLTRQYAPLANNACGAYDAGVVIDGLLPIDQTGLVSGCYLYTQTGTNGVGTASSASVIVKVDTTVPTAGTMTANGISASAAGATSTSATGAWTVTVTPASDPETGATTTLSRATTTTLTNGVCGSLGAGATITAPYAESGMTKGCIRYSLTGVNAFSLAAPVITATVMVDTSAPSGGALTVNGVAATSGGSTSTSASGSFSVSTITAFTDGQSGVTQQSLTRTYGSTCAALDTGTQTSLNLTAPISQSGLPKGCYRYVLAAANGVGGTARLQTDVTVP